MRAVFRSALLCGLVAAAWPAAAGDQGAVASGPEYIKSLEITGPKYRGAWRYVDAGGINWYFLMSAMVLGDYFSPEQTRAAVETAIDRGVIGAWQADSVYANPTRVVIDGRVFFCRFSGKTGQTPPDASRIGQKGQVLTDGSVTWEYLGLTVPKTWQYFLLDVHPNLVDLVHPDSNDAYAGVLIAAVARAGADAAWLAAPSAFPGKNRMELLEELARHNITDDIKNNLSATFQGDTSGKGIAYPIRFLADNVEAWRGLTSLAILHERAGEPEAAARARRDADRLRRGIEGLWDPRAGRFRTYFGQRGYDKLTGDAAFVTDFRFHLWPLLHGLWSSKADIVKYVKPVIAYTLRESPGVWSRPLDHFAMGEWYFIMAEYLGAPIARDVYRRRVVSRPNAAITITDAVLAETMRNDRRTHRNLDFADAGTN